MGEHKKYSYLKYEDELANETHTNKIIMRVRLHTSLHTQKRDQATGSKRDQTTTSYARILD